MGLFDIFSSDPAEDAARARRDASWQGYGKAKDFLRQGTKQAAGAIQDSYGDAIGNYEQLYDLAMPGYQAYGDAAGVYGQEGYDRATENFRANPGYQFQVGQATQAVNRNQAAKGALNSGNTDIDLATYVGGLADQQYDDYVSRLSPYLEQPFQAAGGQANLYANQGDQLANIYTGQGTNLANLATQHFDTVGGANSDAELADYGASANMWGAILGLANAGGKIAGVV